MNKRKQYNLQRYVRGWQRLQRRFGSFKKILIQFAVLIVAGLLLLFLALAIFSPLFDIRSIRIARNEPRINGEQVSRGLAPLIGEHLFFLSTKQVNDLLQASIPDLRQATINKEYPNTLHLKLELDPIIARLKINDPDKAISSTGALIGTGRTLSQTGQDYLTSEGMYVVYDPSQVESGTGLVLLTIVDWGVRPQPWKKLVDSQFLDVMRSAESELKTQFGSTIKSRVIYVRGREFHLQTDKHSLWFDLHSPLAEQLQRYRIFLNSVGADKVKLYVDLRLKDKIVYQ